ncbi:MAG: phage tail protein [Candidatus Elarobacter sp.]
MPEFPVNTFRRDPYQSDKFRVTWDGRAVAGITKVSALRVSTEPIRHREGGDPSATLISPGLWAYAPIVLERGVTHDTAFEEWANQCHSFGGDAAMSLKKFKKDVTLQLLDEQGTPVKAYQIYRCWVSEYQALSSLDADEPAIATERIVLQNEGWERDVSVQEPAET